MRFTDVLVMEIVAGVQGDQKHVIEWIRIHSRGSGDVEVPRTNLGAPMIIFWKDTFASKSLILDD